MSAFIHPTQSSGRHFSIHQAAGPVVMLNLLRYREFADYSAYPSLAPDSPISGKEAYQRYMAAVQPMLDKVGSRVLFAGKGGPHLIGPEAENWDLMLLVEHPSKEIFLQFANDEGYLAVAGHRTAALADSRLLPIQPL